MIRFDAAIKLGAFAYEAAFESPSSVSLFGRSGSGKTVTLGLISGLLRPDRGVIVVDDRVLVDTEKGIFVPKHDRRIGLVYQDAQLFPHLTVRQNLLYGRFFAPQQERREELDRVVDLLGIGGLLDRRPGRLSGGEKQRVAIGRALLAGPRLLLMDEPLASLDEARKAEILPYIERLRDQSRVPIVYVSHSLAEVARLASTVVLVAGGKVAAQGSTAEVLHRLDLFALTDRTEAGAIIEAIVERHDAAFGLTELRSRAGLWRLPRLDSPIGTRLRLRVRARDVMLAKSPPADLSALNIVPGVVADMDCGTIGPIVEIKLDCNGDVLIARLTRFSVERLGLVPGQQIHALVKSVALDRRDLSGPIQATAGADAEANAG